MNTKTYLVTSVIDVPQKALSYTKTRSVFSREERIIQTKQTIESIRRHDTHAKICLIEIGKTNEPHIFDVDFYIHAGGHSSVKFWATSKYKGIGETKGILYALRELSKRSQLKSNNICKLSGRYYLTGNNKEFKERTETSTKMIFKTDGYGYSTRLYFVPHSMMRTYKTVLRLSIPFCLLNRSLERVFKWLIPKQNISIVTTLGVTGQIAVDGNRIEE